MNRPFYRQADPVRVPVSKASADNPFDMTGKIPPNAKTFMFINACPFDIRLKGSGRLQDGSGEFAAVTPENGWLILARKDMGPFMSQMPKWLSVQAMWYPWMTEPIGFDYTECYLELVYGEGD